MPEPSLTPDDLKALKAASRELGPLFRYRNRAVNDPLRLAILAAHALIEELIELVIAEAVPHSECFEVPKMNFWRKLKIIRALELPPENNRLWVFIDKLTALRNAAAHRDYEETREQKFGELAKAFPNEPAWVTVADQELLLEVTTEICAGVLMGMRADFRRLRQRSQQT